MIVINLWGAPSCGKSTGAAYIFSQLKIRGFNVELVAEFAKDNVWEENWTVIKNQAYVFGQQYHRQYRLQDKVDIVVTDSPIPLSIIYNTNPVLNHHFNEMIWECFDSFENWNYLLDRVHDYQEDDSRIESQKRADEIADEIWQLLRDNDIDFLPTGGAYGFDLILNDILERLAEKK